MRRTVAVVLSLFMVGALSAVVRASAEDDIKAAGNAFRDAMQKGDWDAAKKHAIVDDSMDHAFKVLTDLTAARTKLVDAAVAKFGDEGKTIFPAFGPGGNANRFQTNWEKATIEVNGDSAKVTPKPDEENAQQPRRRPRNPGTEQPQERTFTFKKADGEWKLDLTDLPNKDRITQGVQMMEKMTPVLNETAGEIKDGKYSSLQEARQALISKMRAVGGGFNRPRGGGGAGGPAGGGAAPGQ